MPLHDYTTGKVIGKGTYGEVSLVKHKNDKKQYVIKRVDIHKASKREQEAAELEAQLLSQIRHPNIVSYKESFQADYGVLCIVMAYCEGGDMYSRLKAQKGTYLEERQIVEWFVQIAMALQYLHDRRILHRDLKTQNIFLTKSKIIKVGDLGIAKVLENASDMATTLIGTPYYMSPELFSNKPYSYKSDVWALGCCLYEMCTLKHAFNAKDMNSLVYKILKGKLPTMPKIYSDDLCDIIRSMLGQDPDKRPSVARLLRHSFIKKQIALFLEGTKNRQKKNLKSKEAQGTTNTPESSKASDSGYSGMDSHEDPKTKNSAKSKPSGNKDSNGRNERYVDLKEKGARESGSRVVSKDKASKIPSHEQRQVKEVTKITKKPHNELQSQDKRAAEIDGRPESSDRQSSASRPLPPKPPSRNIVDPSNNPDTRVARERRRYKVPKQAGEKRHADSPENSRESVGHEELKPKVSCGNPTSARERRRQRERESMGKASVLPSSLSSEKISGSAMSSEKRVSHSSQSSPVDVDITDGPPARVSSSEKKSQITKRKHSGSVENPSSEDTDTEEYSQEDDEIRKKPRRKESSDVHSLISALDTTLKFSEQRRSPEFDQETQEDNTDEQDDPGDVSVSTGRLRDRIEFLRRDCIQGLGEADFREACNIIDNQPEESVERALVELMGRVKFEKYGGKIWQLKFCETFKRS
ncbi:serine/threonine-protein kinase Nek4-like isoform X2 [Dendronephthya gigantea]|uniref:serine/threonine-protein kinase Nek4-like isoform X2 n=1 Tax=Dendronephthya gigantea TaxID=151771 RepID=UPI0010696F5E|nr:serine/threonine-protein kinase Nek4-like isoform X2 [Dendronephthya gigantea]